MHIAQRVCTCTYISACKLDKVDLNRYLSKYLWSHKLYKKKFSLFYLLKKLSQNELVQNKFYVKYCTVLKQY